VVTAQRQTFFDDNSAIIMASDVHELTFSFGTAINYQRVEVRIAQSFSQIVGVLGGLVSGVLTAMGVVYKLGAKRALASYHKKEAEEGMGRVGVVVGVNPMIHESE
jgi:hypothetical protein